ncbi:hypothetical protein [Paenibacillus glufosinatiresistens]|uniref:hypothetical protein n=1 Tax=Paenibacillus glufosinatiresistens TaxID=3070657 RepID=UPI00286E339D|nr:hypothetical protein [Paenibacillus sp. YX.27]
MTTVLSCFLCVPSFAANDKPVHELKGIWSRGEITQDPVKPFKGYKTDANGNVTPLDVSPFTGNNIITTTETGGVSTNNYWNSNNSLYYEYIPGSYTIDYSSKDSYHYKVGHTQAYNAGTVPAPLNYTQGQQATSTWSVTTQVSGTAELKTNYLTKLGLTLGGSYTYSNATQSSSSIAYTLYVTPGYTGFIDACLPGGYANGTAKYKEYMYSYGTGTFIATGNTVSNSNEGGWSPVSNSSIYALHFDTHETYGRVQ